MNVVEDLLELEWDGPLSAVGDIPQALLYGAVLSFAVASTPTALQALRTALEPLFGPATERKSLLGGKRLEWTGKTSVEASVKRGKATVRLGQRIKGNRLTELVDHLAAVPEARDLRITGAVRRFKPKAAAVSMG